MDVLGIISAIVVGSGAFAFSVNKLGKFMLVKYFPMITKFVYGKIKEFDDKYIDTLKPKYGEVVNESESNLAEMLREIADIIEDKDEEE